MNHQAPAFQLSMKPSIRAAAWLGLAAIGIVLAGCDAGASTIGDDCTAPSECPPAFDRSSPDLRVSGCSHRLDQGGFFVMLGVGSSLQTQLGGTPPC